MKKLLIAFDDETANLLRAYPNMSEIIRNATQLYIQHILPDTTGGIRSSYKIIADKLDISSKILQDMDSKLDYIAGKVQ